VAKTKKISTEEFDAKFEAGEDIEKHLKPADDSWRMVISLTKSMTADVKTIADELGINWQATIKVLLDDAIKARKEREARIRGGGPAA
jgi:hypothetical protein